MPCGIACHQSTVESLAPAECDMQYRRPRPTGRKAKPGEGRSTPCQPPCCTARSPGRANQTAQRLLCTSRYTASMHKHPYQRSLTNNQVRGRAVEQKATTAPCVGRETKCQIDDSLDLASRVGSKSGRSETRSARNMMAKWFMARQSPSTMTRHARAVQKEKAIEGKEGLALRQVATRRPHHGTW